MRPLSFSPGPSKISPETYADMHTIAESGFLETSHRGQTFYDVSSECLQHLRRYLNIPDDYQVFFIDSASSAWHSIIANAVATHSSHLINGAFSQKAFAAAQKLYKEPQAIHAPLGSAFDMTALELPAHTELITACYNESSTGVMMSTTDLSVLRQRFPEQLLAIDITSAAAAIALPLDAADIWYFSVQKGFGLPAGLGVLILSPRARERSVALEGSQKNLAGMWRWSEYEKAYQAAVGQTIQTPNMLGIALLNKQLQRFLGEGGLEVIAARTDQKADRIGALINDTTGLAHFVTDAAHRSPTVIVVSAAEATIATLQERAAAHHVVLGAGYGELKANTFRIGNFPAVTEEDISVLAEILQSE